MRKTSLDVSALRVESFETVDDKTKARGTVHGYYTEITCPKTQCGEECLSGWRPCQPTDAFTNGYQACFCNQTLECPVEP